MLDKVDAAYFMNRAKEERRKADVAGDMATVAVHRQMAQMYAQKALQLTGVIETD